MQIDGGSIVLDRSQLRSITMDDEDLMKEVVTALLDDASHQIERLDRAIELADAKECARLAHSAYGACGNVGAASLAALFSAVERKAAAGDVADCKPWIANLANELEKLRSEASTLLQ
jgi:HPt (histidine-containing phosphotransfer) domain-containing protein